MSKSGVKLTYFLFVAYIFLGSSFVSFDRDDCEFNIKVEITNATSDQDNGIVKLIPSKEGRYYYAFHKGKNSKMLNVDVQSSSLTGLKKGRYFCYVMNQSGCGENIEFEIR